MNKIVSERLLIVLIVLSISLILISKIYKKSDKTISVFQENDNNITYTLDIEGEGITTRTLNYFKDDIIAIYPSNKYKNIDRGWYYIDNTVSFNSNMKLLENYYKKQCERNSNDYINIELNGVSISKVKIITNNINKYNKYKYQK